MCLGREWEGGREGGEREHYATTRSAASSWPFLFVPSSIRTRSDALKDGGAVHAADGRRICLLHAFTVERAKCIQIYKTIIKR